MFLRLAGRHCLVVGAGVVAEGKITALLSAGARVTVVAPRARRRIACMARGGRIVWHKRKFRARDLAEVFLVVAATSSPQLHERIWREARRRGVLCNVVDDPPRCDFYYPAIVRRGALQIAISTSGQSPALRNGCGGNSRSNSDPATHRGSLSSGKRGADRCAVEPSIARRKKFAHEMVRREFPRMLQTASARRARSFMKGSSPIRGKVYLVGAGPGDPELLTLRALRLLRGADAVLHDDLVPAGNSGARTAAGDSRERGQALRREGHHPGGNQRAHGRSGLRGVCRGPPEERRSFALWPCGRGNRRACWCGCAIRNSSQE